MSQPQRIPMAGGTEEDAFTGWRHLLKWKAGQRKAAKRKYHRRWRKQVRRQVREA